MTNHERIKLAFIETKAPHGFIDIIMKKTENSTNSSAQTKSSTRLIRRALIAAALVVALTTTALAISGTIDFPSFFRSVFRNEQAEPFVISGDGIKTNINETEGIYDSDSGVFINDGFEIKLISAFYDINPGIFYLELEITDPTGERLSDSFMLFTYEEGRGYIPLNLNYYVPSEVEFINENTVRAGVKIWHNTDNKGEIKFDLIMSDFNQESRLYQTGIKVKDYIDIETPLILPNVEFVQIDEITYNSGTLKVLYRNPDPSVYGWGSGMLGIQKPDGEILWHHSARNITSDFSEAEIMFSIDEITDEHTFVWEGHRAKHFIKGNWEFTITGETGLAESTFNAVVEGLRTEVTVSSLGVNVYIYDAPDFETSREMVLSHQDFGLILHLADGSMVEPVAGGAEGGTDVVLISYIMDFINPKDVVMVTFRDTDISN